MNSEWGRVTEAPKVLLHWAGFLPLPFLASFLLDAAGLALAFDLALALLPNLALQAGTLRLDVAGPNVDKETHATYYPNVTGMHRTELPTPSRWS